VEQVILHAWRRLGRAPGTTVVVGFSGGPDSLALAIALARAAPLGLCTPVLAHVDHRLRAGSREDADRAARAPALGLPFHQLVLSRSPVLAHPGVGLEEAARRERFAALVGLANGFPHAVIALAHHADDQAETILLHLLRGAGPGAGAGMAEAREVRVPWWDDRAVPSSGATVWRPLLGLSRDDLRCYRERCRPGWTPVVDPSNDDERLRRNAVRHRLIPVIEGIVPGSTGRLARFATLVAEEEDWLERLTAEALVRCRTPGGTLIAERLRDLPRPLRRRVVRTAIATSGHPPVLPSAGRTEAIVAAIERGRGGAVIEVGDGIVVRIGGGLVHIERIGRDVHGRTGGVSATAIQGADGGYR